jgi:hypothetical protein
MVIFAWPVRCARHQPDETGTSPKALCRVQHTYLSELSHNDEQWAHWLHQSPY